MRFSRISMIILLIKFALLTPCLSQIHDSELADQQQEKCKPDGTSRNDDTTLEDVRTVVKDMDSIDAKDSLQEKVNTLNKFGLAPRNPANSCAEILQFSPCSKSGYYWVSDSTGQPHRVYCDMTRSCGGVTGGWMRVAHLNMTDATHQCPDGLIQRTDSDVRSCAVYSDFGSCSSVLYSSNGVSYSQVCGKILGHHGQTLDGFFSRDIDSIYLDGVSLTYSTPRQHIWSFAARSFCPCKEPPPFVGDNYFCDGADFGSNQLWDGQCRGNSCCTFNNPPWFHRQLSQTAADDIEMRLCRNQHVDAADMTVEVVEIYVQ